MKNVNISWTTKSLINENNSSDAITWSIKLEPKADMKVMHPMPAASPILPFSIFKSVLKHISSNFGQKSYTHYLLKPFL